MKGKTMIADLVKAESTFNRTIGKITKDEATDIVAILGLSGEALNVVNEIVDVEFAEADRFAAGYLRTDGIAARLRVAIARQQRGA